MLEDVSVHHAHVHLQMCASSLSNYSLCDTKQCHYYIVPASCLHAGPGYRNVVGLYDYLYGYLCGLVRLLALYLLCKSTPCVMMFVPASCVHAGPGYRNVVGLPGGIKSPYFKLLQAANANNMELREGQGNVYDVSAASCCCHVLGRTLAMCHV
jgi:hypothetical protein